MEIVYVAVFFGRPPFAPLARAARVLASDVRRPPFRPSATAAGFLRAVFAGMVAGNVLCGQRPHALQGQLADLGGERLIAGDVASGECGISFGHKRAAVDVHASIKAKRLGFVKLGIC